MAKKNSSSDNEQILVSVSCITTGGICIMLRAYTAGIIIAAIGLLNFIGWYADRKMMEKKGITVLQYDKTMLDAAKDFLTPGEQKEVYVNQSPMAVHWRQFKEWLKNLFKSKEG